jgi:hypothetical protein
MEGLARSHWNPSRQCTATNRAGERCQRQPIPGGHVCAVHGGKAPQTVAAAKLRLLAMVELVLGVLDEVLAAWRRTRCTGCGHVDAQGNTCRGCGHPTGDARPVIQVYQLVLDRAGFHPTLAVEHVAPEPAEWTRWLTSEQLEMHRAAIADARQRMESGEPAPTQVVVDVRHAEIIDGLLVDSAEVAEADARTAFKKITSVIVSPPDWDRQEVPPGLSSRVEEGVELTEDDPPTADQEHKANDPNPLAIDAPEKWTHEGGDDK